MRAKTQKHVCNLKASFLLVSRFVLVMAASRFLGLFLVLCLIATTVFASPDGEGEPQDLGAGRRGKASTIRRGGGFGGGAALSTSGFFSFQGNHEEYDEEGDEELGEAIAGPAPEGLGEALDAKLATSMFSTEAKVAVKEIVEKAVSAASTKRLLHREQRALSSNAATKGKGRRKGKGNREWEGSFNMTHATEVPATDGKLEATTLSYGEVIKGETDKQLDWLTRLVRSGCLTQSPIMMTPVKGDEPRLVRSHWTCTSCRPGRYLQIRTHKTMAGSCPRFSVKPELRCVPLNSNILYNNWMKGDRICTKGGIVKQVLKVSSLEDAAARKHFAPLTKGSSFGSMEAHCRAWKQVVCRGRACRVKKHVKCVKACRWQWRGPAKQCPLRHMARLPGFGSVWNKKCYVKWKRCSPKYCKGRYGAMACKESAMTF